MTDIPPLYELSVERHIAAPPAVVWRVMTERLAEWWCPKPWTTEVVEQDWRPGGRSAMVMHGPNGEAMPMDGVFLDVIPGRSFVFTDAFTKGWQPQKAFMVGFFQLTATDGGTHYRAGARHWDETAMEQHEAMGFADGWTAVATQLATLAEAEAARG